MPITIEKTAKARAPVAIDWPYRFTFKKPQVVFGETYSMLTLREPTADELLKCGMFDDEVTPDRFFDLIAVLAGLTPATIRAIAGTEALRLVNQLLQGLTEAK